MPLAEREAVLGAEATVGLSAVLRTLDVDRADLAPEHDLALLYWSSLWGLVKQYQMLYLMTCSM